MHGRPYRIPRSMAQTFIEYKDVSNTVAREVSMNGSKCRTDDLS